MDLAIEGTRVFSGAAALTDELAIPEMALFRTDAEGTLTTPSGYIVQPEIPIRAGASRINISRDGIISVLQQGADAAENVGQITIADFTNRIGVQLR